MVGNVIQQKRKEMGLTQAQLAERLGVTAPAVNRWERDLSFPDAALLAPLARCLKIDLNELFSFYDSLSDKERELILDKARAMLFSGEIEAGLKYIEAVIRENPSDGKLYKDVADMLFGIHTLKQPGNPSIFLDNIAEYYERALSLLPEAVDDIAYSLITVYGKLGDSEKAEEAWNSLTDKKQDKKWAHAELLYLLEDYEQAVPEIKGLVLRQALDLSRKLNFLHDALMKANDSEAAELALDIDSKLREVFGVWRGWDVMNRVVSATEDIPGDFEEVSLASLIQTELTQETLSTCPLFADVELGGKPKGESSSADLMADILSAIKKLK